MGLLGKLFGREVKTESIGDPARAIYDLRKCEIFRDVPEENVREMVGPMRQIRGKAGDVIIREGEEGDFYYVLRRGTAEVLRHGGGGHRADVVAELPEGAGFGEEALISGAKRNATVRLKTDGLVLRLPKGAFADYVQKSLVRWLLPGEASEEIKLGAQWLDVRDAAESGPDLLPGALSIPLAQLRERVGELDREVTYICCCEDGRLSGAAAFLLRQRRLDVAALQGGLASLRAR